MGNYSLGSSLLTDEDCQSIHQEEEQLKLQLNKAVFMQMSLEMQTKKRKK